jgi:chromosome segregation ATPase
MTIKTTDIQEKVNSICNAFMAEHGQPPKIRYLISQVGEFTSSSTAHKYFATWRRQYDDNQQAMFDKLGLSEDFNNALMREVKRFTTQAENRYESRIHESKELTNSMIVELELIEDKCEKQSQRISEQFSIIEALKKELSESEKGKSVIEAELRSQIEVHKKAEREASNNADKIRTDLAKEQLRNESNVILVKEVKAQNKTILSDNKKLEKELASTSKQVAQLEAVNKGHESLISELKDNSKRLGSDKNEATQKEIELRSELKVVSNEKSTLEVKLSELSAKHKELENNFNLLLNKEEKQLSKA